MTDHPITPPPTELVGEWLCDDGYPWDPSANATITITTGRLRNVATQAARWGADQELEACCEWLKGHWLDKDLRKHRRPKPPSLKEQALQALYRFDDTEDYVIIRRALESLPD